MFARNVGKCQSSHYQIKNILTPLYPRIKLITQYCFFLVPRVILPKLQCFTILYLKSSLSFDWFTILYLKLSLTQDCQASLFEIIPNTGLHLQAIFVNPKTGEIEANADFRKQCEVDGF